MPKTRPTELSIKEAFEIFDKVTLSLNNTSPRGKLLSLKRMGTLDKNQGLQRIRQLRSILSGNSTSSDEKLSPSEIANHKLTL